MAFSFDSEAPFAAPIKYSRKSKAMPALSTSSSSSIGWVPASVPVSAVSAGACRVDAENDIFGPSLSTLAAQLSAHSAAPCVVQASPTVSSQVSGHDKPARRARKPLSTLTNAADASLSSSSTTVLKPQPSKRRGRAVTTSSTTAMTTSASDMDVSMPSEPASAAPEILVSESLLSPVVAASSPALSFGSSGRRLSVSSVLSSGRSRSLRRVSGGSMSSMEASPLRWTQEEHARFLEGVQRFRGNWKKVQLHIGTKTVAQCRQYSTLLMGKTEEAVGDASPAAKRVLRWQSICRQPTAQWRVAKDLQDKLRAQLLGLARRAGATKDSERQQQWRRLSVMPGTESAKELQEQSIQCPGTGGAVPTCRSSTSSSSSDEEGKQSTTSISSVLGMVLEFLPSHELLQVTPLVSKFWSDASAMAMSWRTAGEVKAENDTLAHMHVMNVWAPFLAAFPWARFLSDGAYKAVYRVYCAARGREEALSVMNLTTIAETGNLPVVRQEILGGCMVSELVRRGLCSAFIQTYQVFTLAYPPPSTWGCRESPAPMGQSPTAAGPQTYSTGSSSSSKSKGKSLKSARAPKAPKTAGVYQYIRTELCRGGDAEEVLRRELQWSMDVVVNILFQLAYGLYTARERLSLRHGDLKLLNVLLQPVEASTLLKIGFGDKSFLLRLALGQYEAKIADYGTVDTSAASLDAPICDSTFTTLENMPPECFWAGNGAKQGYAIDTFMLGLCVLHMLSGHQPYEETMADVIPTPKFVQTITQAWTNNAAVYGVLRKTLDDDSTQSLATTVYRWMVLLDDAAPDSDAFPWPAAPAATAVQALLKSHKPTARQFAAHRATHNLWAGTHPLWVSARQRCAEVEGLEHVLRRMLCANANDRATMYEIITSTACTRLEAPADDPSAHTADVVREFTCYANPSAVLDMTSGTLTFEVRNEW